MLHSRAPERYSGRTLAVRPVDLAFLLACAAVPVGLFLVLFHPQVADPRNVSWLLQGDWGAHAVGWNALRNDDWRWPLGATRLLAWPTGVTVAFTDSNPLLSLLLKPFDAVLPEQFQFTGLWFLGCLVLHFSVAFALVRPSAPDRWTAALGAALLSLVPTLLNRIGHATLFAHWTILLSLLVFVRVEREGRRDLFFGLILFMAALLHPYLLLMNAAVWGADLLRRAAARVRARSLAGLLRLAVRGLVVLAAPVAAVLLSGGLADDLATIGGFGHYSMALDALVNPGREEGSLFFGTAPQGPGQLFEGFQYLGAGLLLMMAAAGAALVLSPAARARLSGMTWLAWLAPALLVLWALALSDRVQLHGQEVAHLPYGWLPMGLTDAFRASGRLFWPCAYALVTAALFVVFALRLRFVLTVLAAALALQAADLVELAGSARALTAAARQPELYLRTPDPAWTELMATAELVDFQPPDPQRDERLFYELAWRASSLRRPIDVMYTARPNRGQQAIENRDRRDFLAGRLDPARLYVLADGCPPPGIDPARLRLLDGVPVIPPARAGLPLPPAPQPGPIALGQTIAFAPGDAAGRCALGGGWSRPDGWGVWSDGAAPELLLRLSPPAGDLVLTFVARGFPLSGQAAAVEAQGRVLGRLTLQAGPTRQEVVVPRSAVSGGLLRLTLRVEHPVSPKALRESPDERLLGIGLESLRIDLAPEPPPGPEGAA